MRKFASPLCRNIPWLLSRSFLDVGPLQYQSRQRDEQRTTVISIDGKSIQEAP
jgi:hypothetical protein